MSDEQDKLKVSLEPPKLFGRKKKQPSAGDAPAEAPATPRRRPAASPSSAGHTDATTDEVAEEPVEEEVDDTTSPETAEPTEILHDLPPAAEDDVAAESTTAESGPEPVVEPVPEPEPAPEPAEVTETAVIEPVVDAPEPHPAPARKARPAKVTALAAEAAPAPAPKVAPAKEAVTRTQAPRTVAVEPEPVTDLDLEDAEIAAAARADNTPLLDRYPAAALTGGIVGVTAVALIWLFLRGCEAVRGTASCGGGPGLILLLLTFAACIVLGSTLLKAFSVREPGTTSFLAAGVVAAISLTFLVEALDSWPIVIIVPLLSIAAYLGSVKLTDLIDETADSSS